MTRIAGIKKGETYPSPPAVAGGGVSDGLLVWRPDGAGDVKTWVEVMVAIGASKGPLTVFCPQIGPPPLPVYVIPPGAGSPSVIYDTKGSQIVAPRGPHDAIPMQLQRGATLLNLSRLAGGVRLQANKFVGDPPGLTFTTPDPGIAPNFVVDDGAEIKNLANATAPLLDVTNATNEFYLVFNQLGNADVEPGGFPTVFAEAGSILNIVVLSGGLSLDTIQRRGWIGSAIGAVENWIHDGTMAFPFTPPDFWDNSGAGYHPQNLGTLVNQPTGCVGGMGPTANRPVFQGGGNPGFGCMYFDTTLAGGNPPGKPIWFNGNGVTGWVDATGAAV